MKKTIIKFFAAITLVLGFAMTIVGQNPSDDATIAANATVVGTIAVLGAPPLDFGLLYATGGSKQIDIDAGSTTTGNITGGTQQHGIFRVTKGTGTTVTLTFTAIPDSLSGPTSKLGITYFAKWTTDPDDGTGGDAVSVVLNNPTSPVGLLTDPIVYIHLGGIVTPDIAGTQAAETYTANVTLKAEFN